MEIQVAPTQEHPGRDELEALGHVLVVVEQLT